MTTPDKNEQEPIGEVWWAFEGVKGAKFYENCGYGAEISIGTRLYTSPPNAKSIRAAALMEAVEAIKPKNTYISPKLREMRDANNGVAEVHCDIINNLITQSDKDALRELMIKVAARVDGLWAEKQYPSGGSPTQKDIDAVVERVLEGK